MTQAHDRAALDCLRAAVEAAQEKKAEGIEVLDLRAMTSVTGYFLICHGTSNRQVRAIVDEIDRSLRKLKTRPAHVEGEAGAEWVLMDYIDFVVHVFTPDRRTFYALEKLWAEAPRVRFPSPEPARVPAGRPSRT